MNLQETTIKLGLEVVSFHPAQARGEEADKHGAITGADEAAAAVGEGMEVLALVMQTVPEKEHGRIRIRQAEEITIASGAMTRRWLERALELVLQHDYLSMKAYILNKNILCLMLIHCHCLPLYASMN